MYKTVFLNFSTGGIEGRRIPPPALTPLTNVPKPPTLDSFDQMAKKKKKKKKDRDRKEATSPLQKSGHPSDIPPPRGFAAPLHPPQMTVIYSTQLNHSHSPSIG